MYLSPLGRLIQIYAYICAFGERAAPGIMKFKVRCPEGHAVLYYMTLFSLSLAPHLLVRPLRAGKILPLLHKLRIKRLQGQKEGKASGGGKKQEKCEAYCGKMKRDQEGVKPASLGASKKNCSAPNLWEKRKHRRAEGNWRQSKVSSAAVVQEAWTTKGRRKTQNKALKALGGVQGRGRSPHGTHRVGADEDEGAERSRADMSSCLRRCLLYERESLLRGFIVRWI